jgi:heat shock protein HslJ
MNFLFMPVSAGYGIVRPMHTNGGECMSGLFKALALAASTLLAALVTPAQSAEVLLQSALTNAFVRVSSGTLAANGHADNALRVEMIRLEGDRVAFRARDGSYLRAGISQQTLLATGSAHIRGWETFQLVRAGSGFAFRSVQNGKYVEVDRASGRLSATATVRGTHSQFSMINAPGRAAARAPAFNWTGSWNQIWIASPNGRLHRPPTGSRVEFTVADNLSIATSMGCNRLSTAMRINAQSARFSGVTQTKRSCGNQQQGYEQGMAIAFDAIRSWEFREGQVAFLDSAGRTVLQIGR